MCGIAGVMGVQYLGKAEEFIRDSLVAGMLRGYDSAGIFQADRKGKIWFHKDAVEGMYLAGSKEGASFIKDAPKMAATITHTRAATQGSVTKANAHPFVVHKPNGSPLVGCHNGSLTTAWKNKPNAKGIDVDSHWALKTIAEKGVEAFKEIFGAYCFVWVEDDKPGKVFMARNSQRPMHLLWTKDGKNVLFASEPGMLAWIAERNKIDVREQIMVLGEDHIYEFDCTGNVVQFSKTAIPKSYTPATTATRTAGTTGATGTTVVSATGVMGDPPKAPGQLLNAAGVAFVDRMKLAANGKLNVVGGVSQYSPARPMERADILDAQEAAEALAKQRAVDQAVADIVGEGDAIAQQRTDDAPFLEEDSDLVPLSWFSSRGTKQAELQTAKAQGFYRELQWFEGIAWDENTGELMGDVQIWDSKKGKINYTGVIRAISQARAHTDYVDNGLGRKQSAGGWVVVSGMYHDRMLNEMVFVCSELNMIGKQAMMDQKKKAN